MATDIYNNTVSNTTTGLIKAQEMKLTIAGGDAAAGALVQNITIRYTQPIQIIREVGSYNYYYHGQAPAGSLSVGRLVSTDKKILDIFPNTTNGANVWKVPQGSGTCPTITLSDDANKVKYTLDQCIVTNFGVTVDRSSEFVQERIDIVFASMTIGSLS